MLPSHSGFKSDDTTAVAVYLGLIHEKELIQVDSLVEFRAEGDSLAELGVHGLSKEAINAMRFRLRSIQGNVGVGQQFHSVRRILSKNCNANAGARSDCIS